jgi:hypothetical protein
VGRSVHPGIPPVEKCLYCHKYIIANHPEIRSTIWPNTSSSITNGT